MQTIIRTAIVIAVLLPAIGHAEGDKPDAGKIVKAPATSAPKKAAPATPTPTPTAPPKTAPPKTAPPAQSK